MQFIEQLDMSKREFYAKTGVSRGTLENIAGITETIVTRSLPTYQNISPEWLLTGIGSMEKMIDNKW